MSEIASHLVGYEPKDIFNYDETALFFRLLPKKSYLTEGSDLFGTKQSKERITIGLCCSMKGEKLKPVIVGKAAKPRCFKSISISLLI